MQTLRNDSCRLHDSEAALAMQAALAPPFMALRRILVQLGGLMLLADGRRAETRDGAAVTLAVLQSDIAEAVEALRGFEARLGRRTTKVRRMLAAAGGIERARASLAHAPVGHGALATLQAAQRDLLAVSDDRLGMAMVGFAHACCCSPTPQAAALRCA